MTTPLSPCHQTALVFAARYAHDRKTGAALSVVTALRGVWPQLDQQVRDKIVKESWDATANQDDWQDLRNFAETFTP